MAFPGPGYKSPRKKEDLKKGKGAIIETDQYMTKKQLKLYRDIGEALLKYSRSGATSVFVDDIKVDLFPLKGDKWKKMSFYFKVVK